MAATPFAGDDNRSLSQARCALAVFALLALTGVTLGFRGGQLPQRQPASAAAEATAAKGADLALYREVVAAVRAGEGYYPAARRRLPAYGFPIRSPLNWRLPTYAWFFAALQYTWMVQVLLALLAAVAIYVAFISRRNTSGIGAALGTAVLLLGVVGWAFDGQAYLAQEVWAATLITLSLGAHALARAGEGDQTQPWWTALAIGSGLAALFFRELALPYCGVALLLAAWNRQGWEAASWAVGIAAFFAFFAWHVREVQHALAGIEAGGGGLDLAQWLRFGGLEFVLLTTRLNRLLFAAPGWILWLYVLASLVGLARRRDETSTLACLAALAYLLAFAIAGRPENFYWGLLPAPLLAWGPLAAPASIASLWRSACGRVGLEETASDGTSPQATTAVL